jgi:hypothetical protein
VLRDEVVFFYKLEQESKEAFYRRIEFYDQEHDRVLVFCGDFGQCLEDATLDGTDRHAAGEILATTIDVRLVPLESGGSIAPAIVCLP